MFILDPDGPLAVGLVIAALAVCAGAIAAALFLSLAQKDGRRRGGAAGLALRRGIEVTTIVGLLLLLRVVDGLTVITGGFIVVGIVVAEVILSARPKRATR